MAMGLELLQVFSPVGIKDKKTAIN